MRDLVSADKCPTHPAVLKDSGDLAMILKLYEKCGHRIQLELKQKRGMLRSRQQRRRHLHVALKDDILNMMPSSMSADRSDAGKHCGGSVSRFRLSFW